MVIRVHNAWTLVSFDGTVCQSKRFTGAGCTSPLECRTDFNLTCLRFLQCGRECQFFTANVHHRFSLALSVYDGVTVAGYGNGSFGSDSLGLHTPAGIQVTPNGDLLVTDSDNSRVQRFSNNSRLGHTVAGNGINGSSLEQLSMPITMYLNTIDNHLYVAEHANQRIQLWLSNASVGRTVVGGSTNNLGRLAGVRLDSHGNLYVSETIPGHRLLRWSANASNGTNGTVLLGVGTIGSDERSLNNPRHLDIDANNEYLFVTDNGNNRIQRISLLNLTGIALTVAGGNGSGLDSSQLNSPRSVCVSRKTGALYVADTNNQRVQRWALTATQGVTIAGDPAGASGITPDKLFWPAGVALSADETFLFVADQRNHRIQRFRLI